MKTPRWLVVLGMGVLGANVVFAADKTDTPHVKVVGEYIRLLGVTHAVMSAAGKDFKEDDSSGSPQIAKMMSTIRNSTRMIMELNIDISTLKGMSLGEPFDELLPNTIKVCEVKVGLHREMVSIAKVFAAGTPPPGVDCAKLVGRLPEITTLLGFADQSIFETMPLVFALLIDQTPDSQGHCSRLTITKAEKKSLIENIDNAFGDSLEKKGKNHIVGAAALLKAYLSKNYKCSDE